MERHMIQFQDNIIHRNYYLCSLGIRKLALFTVVLPFAALFICFVTAYIFQYDDVHETHCKVYNVIPSISAITGVTPQSYLWRLCVAVHIGPRILVANIYYNYFSYLHKIFAPMGDMKIHFSVIVCYWLNITELSALCGVTYISNRENYPIHEKLFVTFMLCSLTHMGAMTWIYGKVHHDMTFKQHASFCLKKTFWVTSLASTGALVAFFVKHRFYCHDLAFTWFAFSEYVIAFCNMGFHLTVMMDFPSEKLIVPATALTAAIVNAANVKTNRSDRSDGSDDIITTTPLLVQDDDKQD